MRICTSKSGEQCRNCNTFYRFKGAKLVGQLAVHWLSVCYFLVITLLDKELIKGLELVSSLVFAFEIWRGQIYLKVDTAAAIIVHVPLAILHYEFCILLSKLLLHLSHRLEPF